MSAAVAAGTVLCLGAVVGCAGSSSPTDRRPAPVSTAPGPGSGSGSAPGQRPAHGVTVVAAGDIGASPESGAGTARLIRQIDPDVVVTLGDNAYDAGTSDQYRENYDPTWGEFRSITRPAPGNHEYDTAEAAGYFDYFRAQVHDRPYYAWNAGHWRLYSLNCEIPCGAGSPELDWLRRDLRRIGDRPAIGYVHEPLFSCSLFHPPVDAIRPVFEALDDANGQLLLTGHNHSYERFAPMHGDGTAAADGVREIVVGTGGADLYPLASDCPHRQAASDTDHGVLELTLTAHAYRWSFRTVDGTVADHGRRQVG